MKLTIKRLGPIEDAELEIRPLTVLLGKNGSGKTWLAHTLFKMLRQFRFSGFVDPDTTQPDVVAAARDIAGDWIATIDAADKGSAVVVSARRHDLLSRLPSRLDFRASTADIADAIGADPGPDASAVLSYFRRELDDGVFSEIEATMTFGARLGVKRTLRGAAGEHGLMSYPLADELSLTLERALRALVLITSFDIRALPAERVFLANHFDAVLRERFDVPWALRDFCGMLSEASETKRLYRDDIAAKLDTVLDGRFAFEDDKLRLGGAGFGIPAAAASSLGKSLAGLVVFLDRARRADVLVVEEPEMNAHPEAQAAIAELFALMIRQGMNLVVTTHSPYFVDRIVSLLEAAGLTERRRGEVAGRLALKNPEAYVLPSEVAVYELTKTGAKDLLDRKERTIDGATFSDASRVEAELYGDILDRGPRGNAA